MSLFVKLNGKWIKCKYIFDNDKNLFIIVWWYNIKPLHVLVRKEYLVVFFYSKGLFYHLWPYWLRTFVYKYLLIIERLFQSGDNFYLRCGELKSFNGFHINYPPLQYINCQCFNTINGKKYKMIWLNIFCWLRLIKIEDNDQ